MPGQRVHPFLMAAELDHRLVEGPREAPVRDEPYLKGGGCLLKGGEGHLGGGVLRAGGDDIVVEGTPGHLEAGRLVRIHERIILVYSAYLKRFLLARLKSVSANRHPDL